MAYTATVILVMITFPRDVVDELAAARDVIHDWNDIHAGPENAVLLPIGWDTHTAPELGKGPQEIINEKVLAKSDLLVGIFRHRLGTPTGQYPSGSVEEIQRHLASGKPALVYFLEAPAPPDSDPAQLAALAEFRKWCQGNGLPRPYRDSNDFETSFRRHLQITLAGNDYLKSKLRQVHGYQLFGTATVSQAPPGSTLRPESRELLVEAAKDGNAAIMRYATLADGLFIETNGKKFGTKGDARSMARWSLALEELVAQALLEPRGANGDLFQVTDRGFELAHVLQQAQHNTLGPELESLWKEGERILRDSAAGSEAWAKEARVWEKTVEDRLRLWDEGEAYMFATIAWQAPSSGPGTHEYTVNAKARMVDKLGKLRLQIGRAYERDKED